MTEMKKPETEKTPERKHKATYATDKRSGGYLIRVEGPFANQFSGRDVPVTLRNGTEHNERLAKLVWSGNDAENGKPVALYQFESKPREEEIVEF